MRLFHGGWWLSLVVVLCNCSGNILNAFTREIKRMMLGEIKAKKFYAKLESNQHFSFAIVIINHFKRNLSHYLTTLS